MQRKIFRSALITLLALITMMTLPVCSAENFVFVDAEDTTGYYVDKDSVKVESQESIKVTIAIIKAKSNKMYIYSVQINPENHTYQIFSSKILEYDTRNVLEINDNPRILKTYSLKSKMAELVDFILNGDD